MKTDEELNNMSIEDLEAYKDKQIAYLVKVSGVAKIKSDREKKEKEGK